MTPLDGKGPDEPGSQPGETVTMDDNLRALETALTNNGIDAEVNDEVSGVLMSGDKGRINHVVEAVLGATENVREAQTDASYEYELFLH